MWQDNGYRPWDDTFIKRKDGPVADLTQGAALFQARARWPKFFGFPGQVGFSRLPGTQSRKVAERATNRLLPSAMDWIGQ